jgi:hypothetical protein
MRGSSSTGRSRSSDLARRGPSRRLGGGAAEDTGALCSGSCRSTLPRCRLRVSTTEGYPCGDSLARRVRSTAARWFARPAKRRGVDGRGVIGSLGQGVVERPMALAPAARSYTRPRDVQARAAARDGEAVRDQGHSIARRSVDQFARTADSPIRRRGRPWRTLFREASQCHYK